MPELPSQLYTPATLFTLGGMSALTWMTGSAIQSITGKVNPNWVALAMAMLLSFGGLFFTLSTAPHQPVDYLVAFANGLLVYLTALGGSAVAGMTTKAAPGAREFGTSGRRPFLSPWY